jgi:acetyl esterase/lipase
MATQRLFASCFVAVLASCSSSSSSDAPSSDAGTPGVAACPTFVPAMVPGFSPGAAGPPMATTVAPSDTSTSIVLHVDGDPQIQCATTGRTSKTGIVYSSPQLGDGTMLPLQLDVLAPTGATPKPLVVFVPGGGFVTALKDGALDLRSYVADAGFVVASIQYRTIMNGAVYTDGIADVKAAIRFLRANATAYGIDPTAVAV